MDDPIASADALVDDLGDATDEGQLTASLYLVVAAINALDSPDDADSEKQDRLRRLIEKFGNKAREAAKRSGASDVSITVGLPAGLSASVNWKLRHG